MKQLNWNLPVRSGGDDWKPDLLTSKLDCSADLGRDITKIMKELSIAMMKSIPKEELITIIHMI